MADDLGEHLTQPAAEAGSDAGVDPGSGERADSAAGPVSERKPIRAGRNLPMAAAIGVVLGGLVLVTLFTVKATFLAYVGVIAVLALWELRHVLGVRGIGLPLAPIVAGGAAMMTLAYWYGAEPALAALGGTIVVLMAWRLPGGAHHYLRDLSASVFTVAYLPLAGIFVALLLSPADGARRALIFIALTVGSDVGGYFAGILLGRHPMAPVISPNKTWEGLAGSVVLCLAVGANMLPCLLHGHVWQGLIWAPRRPLRRSSAISSNP